MQINLNAPPVQKARNPLFDILPDGYAGLFACMEIADGEIRAAIEKHPDRADDLNKALMILQPPRGMADLTPEIYQHHVRELIGRVLEYQDTRLGTKAEAIMVISDVTLASPPARDIAALYAELFVDIFGEAVYREKINDANYWQHDLHGSWEGATQELLSRLMQKLMNEERNLKLKKAAPKPCEPKKGQLTFADI